MAAQDFGDLPIEELLPSAKHGLSLYLNPLQQIPNSGLLSDWRGVAELRGFSSLHIENFALKDDPTGAMLDAWNCYGLSSRGRTVRTLTDILQRLDRRDASEFLKSGLRMSWENWQSLADLAQGPEQVNQITSASHPVKGDDMDSDLLVIGDRPGQRKKMFDALLIYAEEDFALAWKWTQKLELHQIRILFMDRDLRPGGDHCTILAKSIRDRCKTVIFLATHSAVNSPICDFMVKFAHCLAPAGRGSRSLMMIKFFNDIRAPLVLQPMYHLDYANPHKRKWFWQKLVDYIRLAPDRMSLSRESTDLLLTINRRNTMEQRPVVMPSTSLRSSSSREETERCDAVFRTEATAGSMSIADMHTFEESPDERDHGWTVL